MVPSSKIISAEADLSNPLPIGYIPRVSKTLLSTSLVTGSVENKSSGFNDKDSVGIDLRSSTIL